MEAGWRWLDVVVKAVARWWGDGGKRCGMVVVGQQRCGGGAGLRSARAATVLPPPWVPIVVGGHVH